MRERDPLVVELREARLARGWSQDRLAYHAGVSVSTVKSVEVGRFGPTLSVLRALAGALHRDVVLTPREES